VKKLTSFAESIARGEDVKEVPVVKGSQEVETLASSLDAMLKTLLESRREIENFALKLEKEVARKTEALQKLNDELEQKVRDGINELRKKDEVLLQKAKMADMGEMIGTIAHQWRQPLNALALNVQMLEDWVSDGSFGPDEAEEFVERNLATIQFMSKTIDNFRNFYREEKSVGSFSLHRAIEDTVEMHSRQLEDRGISISLNLSPIEVVSYKNDLMQVLLNLISNARDAILERKSREPGLQGCIEISAYQDGEDVVIEVRDNGGGIPRAFMERIFDPYFTTKEKGLGTGLGLHMTRRIVHEKLDGSITVENGHDGAIFRIRLKVK
jgi:signal transduction histidine kinase